MGPSLLFRWTVIALFSLAAILPIGYMTILPFVEGTGIQEFIAVFERRHLTLAVNSLAAAGGSSLAALITGTVVALFICRCRIPGRQWIRHLNLIPLLIPPYIHAIVWTRHSPCLQQWLGGDIYSLGGVIWVLTLAYFPLVSIPTMAALQSLERCKEEAALLAHSPISLLCRITLPLCLPNMLTGAVLVFVFAMTDVSVADILRVRVYPLEVFIQFSAFFDTAKATLLSLPMVALTLVIILGLRFCMGERSYGHMGGNKQISLFNRGYWRALGFIMCLIIFGTAVLLPVSTLIADAGPPATYRQVLLSSHAAIWRSLKIAGTAAVIVTILGGSLGYLTQRLGKQKGGWLMVMVLLPFAVPATTTGIGLIGVWNRPPLDWIYDSMAILLIAHTARFSAYAALVVHCGVAQVDFRLEEAARIAGAGFADELLTIVFPLTKQQLSAAAVIVFVLAFGELGTTLLITPPGVETVPVKIYNLMHYGAHEGVAALCMIQLILVFAVLSMGLWLVERLR